MFFHANNLRRCDAHGDAVSSFACGALRRSRVKLRRSSGALSALDRRLSDMQLSSDIVVRLKTVVAIEAAQETTGREECAA
jgi:hypothetical protein